MELRVAHSHQKYTHDIQLARARMASAGRKPEGKPYSLNLIIGFSTSWKTLLFVLILMLQPFEYQPPTAFVFWLKAHNKKGQPPVYTVAQIVRRRPSSPCYP
jgi:ACS family pantothenate transporter-like MFS transporter